MISVRTSVSSLASSRHINTAARAVQKSLERLSTGKRINSASDDPAGLAIAARFKNQINSMGQARLNADAGQALVQVAEGAMFQITSIVHRLNSLTLQAANGTLTEDDRNLIQNEVTQLVQEIDRLSSVTKFNGIQLLKGSTMVGNASIGIQVGFTGGGSSAIGINFLTMTSTSLGINGLDISGSDTTNAENSIAALQDALLLVAAQQAKMGAVQNRITFASDFLDLQRVHFSSALSAIEDTDFATELTNYTQQTLLVQSSSGTLAQSNIVMEKVLSLLGVGR